MEGVRDTLYRPAARCTWMDGCEGYRCESRVDVRGPGGREDTAGRV